MALESQGVKIRRVSTESTGIATVASSGIVVTSSGIEVLSTDVMAGTSNVSFVTSGSTTGMRIEITSSVSTYAVASTRIYTAAAVAAKKITLHETATADAATSLHVKGHAMLDIGEVLSWSGPSGSPAVIDVTNLNSDAKEKIIGVRDEGQTNLNSDAKEKIIGVRDEGQISIEVNLNNTATALHLAMNNDRMARTLRQYEVELTDSTVRGSFYFFDAYVTGFSPSGAVDDAIKAAMTLEITDAVHWTPTTV